ncbi:MAG: helix-turn-helix domain-containing protein [bacterium]
MKELNISARNLAKKCGIDSSYLSKILKGKRNLPTDEKVISRIAKAIGADADYLMFVCGRIPGKWQKIFLRKDITEILEKIAGTTARAPRAPVKAEKIAEKIARKIKKPELPDEIL